jgi:hypothetical protein
MRPTRGSHNDGMKEVRSLISKVRGLIKGGKKRGGEHEGTRASRLNVQNAATRRWALGEGLHRTIGHGRDPLFPP